MKPLQCADNLPNNPAFICTLPNPSSTGACNLPNNPSFVHTLPYLTETPQVQHVYTAKHIHIVYFLTLIFVSPVIPEELKSARDDTFHSPYPLQFHKPNQLCLHMVNPELLPQRATWKSRRLQGQQPVSESYHPKVVGSAAMHPFPQRLFYPFFKTKSFSTFNASSRPFKI